MRKFIAGNFQNMFPWAVFITAFGGAAYFSLSFEPDFSYVAITAIVCLATMFIRRMPIVIRAVAFFAFGFCYAAAFTRLVATPQIPHPVRNSHIIGTVTNIDHTPDKARIYINAENINPNSAGKMIVRVSLSNDGAAPKIGDRVRATVTLFPPNGADAPGAFDYARWAYFNKLSATGFMTDFEVIETGRSHAFARLREYIHSKSQSFLTDSLVLGYKNALNEDDGKIWTANGIAHVWSISGFHMTLVSGWLFAIFLLIFRSIPYVTRRVPARIPAMICAGIGLMCYLFISGGGIATIRAFLMTMLVFMAAVFGRNAISTRNVCVAFLILFLFNPHYIMQAGFQLSFAAVMGLVWFWNSYPKMPKNKIVRIIYAAAMTSIVATIFTMPFVVAHFGNLPAYGLIGNLILLPVFSFLIMPLVVVGTIGTLFGFGGALNLAHVIYEFALHVAQCIANLPGANIIMPNIPNTAMMMFIIGFMTLMFIHTDRRRINYIICAIFLFAGVVTTLITPRPVFYATADHELVGFVVDGKLEFNKARAANHFFTFDTWKQINFEPTGTKNIRRRHDHGVYMFDTPQFRLAYIQKFVPLAENISALCRDDTVDFIVTYFDVRAPRCNHKILHDGFVIYSSGRVKHVTASRPWHNRHQ